MLFHHRRPSLDSITSSTCCQNTHEDSTANLIPEGLPSRKTPFEHHHTRGRQPSTSSERSCSDMSADETRDLWRCMLELQERYGCYNSTRVNLALEAGDEALDLMPNRFIIDTLNHSLVDLPEEGREMLDKYLRNESPKQEKHQHRFWKKE